MSCNGKFDNSIPAYDTMVVKEKFTLLKFHYIDVYETYYIKMQGLQSPVYIR